MAQGKNRLTDQGRNVKIRREAHDDLVRYVQAVRSHDYGNVDHGRAVTAGLIALWNLPWHEQRRLLIAAGDYGPERGPLGLIRKLGTPENARQFVAAAIAADRRARSERGPRNGEVEVG